MDMVDDAEEAPRRGILARTFLFLVYPAAVFGATIAAYALRDAGAWRHPGTVGILLAAGLFVFALERRFPYHRAWVRSRGDVRTDLIHNLVNVGSNAAGIAFLVGIVALGIRHPGIWPRSWPFPAQILLAVLVADLGFYAAHRLSHHLPALWRFHAVHHSSTRLYWLNGERRHPVNHGFEVLCGPFLVLLLGPTIEVMTAHGVLMVVHLMFQHSNVDTRMGPLRHVFAVSEVHRFHHQRDVLACRVNYGGFLVVWDHLFGTFSSPKRRLGPDAVGLEAGATVPVSYWGQLLFPFPWFDRPTTMRDAPGVETLAGKPPLP